MSNVAGLFIIVGSLLFGALAIFFILTVLRTHRLVVRDPESNRINNYYWCYLWKDKKNGTTWWKSVFWQKPIKIPEPPDEVVYVNKRGKAWVEVYRLSDSEFTYILDSGIKKSDIVIKDKKKFCDSFKPFSTVQRQVLINQFAKAEAMRQKSWLKENAMNVAALGFMLIIIVLGIVYSGEIFQGISQTQSGANSMIQQASKLYQNTVVGAKEVATATASQSSVVQQGTEDPPKE